MDNSNWKKLNEKLLNKTRVFDLYVQRMVLPGGAEDDFFFIKTADWANVIPTTPDGRVILVQQFRHGTCEQTIETPGGMVNPGELPIATATRELAEETGYVAKEIVPIGTLRPNPAMLNNTCHFFWARDVEPLGKQNLEPAEDIILHHVPIAEIPEWISSGRITHSIAACTFFLFQNRYPDLVQKLMGRG